MVEIPAISSLGLIWMCRLNEIVQIIIGSIFQVNLFIHVKKETKDFWIRFMLQEFTLITMFTCSGFSLCYLNTI